MPRSSRYGKTKTEGAKKRWEPEQKKREAFKLNRRLASTRPARSIRKKPSGTQYLNAIQTLLAINTKLTYIMYASMARRSPPSVQDVTHSTCMLLLKVDNVNPRAVIMNHSFAPTSTGHYALMRPAAMSTAHPSSQEAPSFSRQAMQPGQSSSRAGQIVPTGRQTVDFQLLRSIPD